MNNYSNYENYFMMNQDPAFIGGNFKSPNLNDAPNKIMQEGIDLSNPTVSKMGNNMNFNKCDYNQQNIGTGDLLDPYQGFIRGNMFQDLYNSYKLKKPYDIEPMNEQARMLTMIDSLQFAAHDLNLFLDTHPFNRDMIALFNQYENEAKNIVNEYEKKYGPLFVSSSNNLDSWSWIKSPWPWEYM